MPRDGRAYRARTRIRACVTCLLAYVRARFRAYVCTGLCLIPRAVLFSKVGGMSPSRFSLSPSFSLHIPAACFSFRVFAYVNVYACPARGYVPAHMHAPRIRARGRTYTRIALHARAPSSTYASALCRKKKNKYARARHRDSARVLLVRSTTGE